MADLYKILASLETKPARKYAMGNKRSELITPLFQDISSKHYIGLWRVRIFHF
jgi:hypothetical protein